MVPSSGCQSKSFGWLVWLVAAVRLILKTVIVVAEFESSCRCTTGWLIKTQFHKWFLEPQKLPLCECHHSPSTAQQSPMRNTLTGHFLMLASHGKMRQRLVIECHDSVYMCLALRMLVYIYPTSWSHHKSIIPMRPFNYYTHLLEFSHSLIHSSFLNHSPLKTMLHTEPPHKLTAATHQLVCIVQTSINIII